MKEVVQFVQESIRNAGGKLADDKLTELASGIVSEVSSEVAAETAAETAAEASAEAAAEAAAETASELNIGSVFPFGRR